jgi:hypothetical protein
MPLTATFPKFPLAAPTFPKLNLDTVFALQKANLGAVREVQDILLDTTQALARLQYGWVEGTFAQARAVLTGQSLKNPEAALTDVKGAADRVLAVARQGVELGTTAQRRVAELLAQRTAANLDQLKALAA